MIIGWQSKVCVDCYFCIEDVCREGPPTQIRSKWPNQAYYSVVVKKDESRLACSKFKEPE